MTGRQKKTNLKSRSSGVRRLQRLHGETSTEQISHDAREFPNQNGDCAPRRDYVTDNFSVVDRVSVSGWMMVMMLALHHLHGVAGGTVLLSVGRNISIQIVLLNYDWMLSTLQSKREVRKTD